MKSLVYAFSPARYALSRALGRWFPQLYYGKLSCISLREMDLPELRQLGPRWVRLRPLLSGICGSDMATITGKTSPSLSAFASFPAVLGHETVAKVVEAGEGVRWARTGDRVAVDPFLPCEVRETGPCLSCAQGEPYRCENWAEGRFPPAMLLGFCKELPGCWSEEFVAHESRLHPVPGSVPDEKAVLVEPFSIALHAILESPPPKDGRALIIGGGTIGLCVLAGMKLLGLPSAGPDVMARYGFQRELASRLGARRAFQRKAELLEAMREEGRGRTYKPLIGEGVPIGEYDDVYECTGSRAGIVDAIALARPGGSVVLVGTTALVDRLDMAPVWSKELKIKGVMGYGWHRIPGDGTAGATASGNAECGCSGPDTVHTHDLALRLMEDHPDYPIGELVTHVYPFDRYREAISTMVSKERHRAVKVTLDFRR